MRVVPGHSPIPDFFPIIAFKNDANLFGSMRKYGGILRFLRNAFPHYLWLGQLSRMRFPADVADPPLIDHTNTISVTAQDPLGQIDLLFPLSLPLFNPNPTLGAIGTLLGRFSTTGGTGQGG